MKQMKKRALALLCCLCLFLSGLPMGARAAGSPFPDVKPGDWMYTAVEYVHSHNLMQGTGSGFSPNSTLTRGMFVTILGRMAGVGKANYQGSSFSDVKPGEWYAPYVEWACRLGITNGAGNNTFGVDRAITRQEMAVMVNRYLNIDGLSLAQAQSGLPGFTDSSQIASWAVEDVEAMRKTGLFQGDSAGRFRPGASAKRSEAAVVFMRLDQSVNAALAAEGETLYSITDLQVTGRAAATVSTARSAWLTVRVLSEDKSRVIATGKALVKGGLSGEQVEVQLPESLTERYFVAEADLTDEQGAKLCDTYTAVEYTSAYEEFMALDTSDFPEDKVLNLDEETDNNFMVAAEDALLLEEGESSVWQAGDNLYEVTGAAGAQPGDKLVVQAGEDTLLLTVESVSGDAALAVVDGQPDLGEYFECIKIDAHIDGQPIVEQPGQAEGLQARGNPIKWIVDVLDITEADISPEDGKLTIPLHAGADLGNLSLDVDGTVGLKIHFVLQYSVKHLTNMFLNCEYSTTVSQTVDGIVGLKAEHDDDADKVLDEIDMANLIVPLGVPGLAAKAKVTVPIDWEIKGGMHVHSEGEVESGFKFRLGGEGEWGLHEIARDDFTATADMEAEGSVKFGPKLDIGLTYLGEVFEGKIGVFAGLVLKGTASHPLGAVTNVSQPGAHACSLCLDGEIDTDISLEAEAGVHIEIPFTDKTLLDEKIIDGEIPIVNEHLLDFYVSLINEPQSIHKGKVTFGEGDCPNYLWRVDFPVTDASGKSITATVNMPGAKMTGQNCGYYYPGSYTASATINGKVYTESFTVSNGPLTVPFVAKAAWVEEYAKILRETLTSCNKYRLKPSFALIYLDNDDIPELVVSEDGSHVAPAKIYYYNNGNVKSHEAGVYGSFQFSPKTSMIYVANMGSGIAYDGFGTMKASGYTSTISFHTDEFASVKNPGYWIRDQKVSKSTYERELKKAKNAYRWVSYEHTSKDDPKKSFKITSTNINRMVEKPAQYVIG